MNLEDMPSLKTMHKDEVFLLLFLETQAVDHRGAVNVLNMNEEDLKILGRWGRSGFVESGRICSESIQDSSLCLCKGRGEKRTIWVRLSATAWSLAHEERRNRAERMWDCRKWKTTEEAE